MRLSKRRLEAVISAASRGIDEWEEDEWSAEDEDIQAASEGLACLRAMLRKRNSGQKNLEHA